MLGSQRRLSKMNRISFPLRTHKKSISRHTTSEQRETLEIMQEKNEFLYLITLVLKQIKLNNIRNTFPAYTHFITLILTMAFWLNTVVFISQKQRFEDTNENLLVSTARSHMNSGLPLKKKMGIRH